MSDPADLSPITVEITLGIPADEAFRRFTAGFSNWWPCATHSLSRSPATRCRIDARRGGRVWEVDPAGQEHLWGTVASAEEGSRVRFSWHPGREPASAQWVEVRFTATPQGCLARLEHGGWEALGEIAPLLRAQCLPGWEHVFGGLFRAYAERSH